MTPSAPVDNQPKDPAAPVATAPDFAATMHAIWEKNRKFIYLGCAAVLLVIIGTEAWGYIRTQRDQSVREEYARVASDLGRLAAFANANSGHELAGVAWLRLADEAYTKGDYKAAIANYQKAAQALVLPALQARAKLGVAMSQLGAGDAAGEPALKAIGADAAQPAAIRAEATYHLATLAYTAGRVDDVRKLTEEVTKLEASGVWAQRAFVLRAQLPQDKPAEAAPGGLQFKPGGN